MQPPTSRLLFRLLCLAVLLVLATSPARAQTPPITYQRYDTLITVQADGTFRVREIQQIRFDGAFHTAFAEIPAALTTEIRNVQVYEGEAAYRPGSDAPNTFTTEPSNDALYVSWEYTPTQPGDVRTFVLEYEVVGGLWVYPNETILEWRAVPADRSGLLVASSMVTVTLPLTVTGQLQTTAYGPAFQTAVRPSSVTFTANEPLPDGVSFQVQVGWPAGLIAAERQPWQLVEDAAQLDYRFPALTVELALEADGTLWVDEYHHLAVAAGALGQGYRQIPLYLIDAIDQVALWEGEQAFTVAQTDCNYCLQVLTNPGRGDWVRYDPVQRTVVTDTQRVGKAQIYWQLPPLVRGEETTLHLRYRAQGVVRQLPDRQLLNWTAVFPGREETVESAQVKLQLPPGLPAEQVAITGGQVTWQADGTALISNARAYYAEQAWTLAVTLPVSATHGAKPQWQVVAEQAASQAIQAQSQRARLRLGFGVAALLILLLGGAGVYLIWYQWGRDRPLPPPADYLTEPPSQLPPAIVAYLIDETPSVQGALASLLQLANWGLLRVRFDNLVALQRLGQRELTAGAPLQLPTGETLTLPRHLVTLFNALFPALPDQREVPLHQIYSHFQAALPRVYAEMGEEANLYFDELPAQARHRWLVRGQWVVLLGSIAALILAWVYWQEFGWLAIAPAVAASSAGLALIMASQWMPRRTTQGVEETQRWLAFRQYLRNLQQYGNVNRVQRILDRYFAYAVALGVADLVLEQAAELGGALPSWSYTSSAESSHRSSRSAEPAPPERAGEHSADQAPVTPAPAPSQNPTPPASPDLPRPQPARQRPTLSGLSGQLSAALRDTSQNLGDLLSTAVPDADPPTPFASLWQGTQTAGRIGANVASTTFEILGDILESAASGEGGSGGYSSSSSARSSWSSHSSRSSASSSSFSSGRSSSSRRSGGGGRRGFG